MSFTPTQEAQLLQLLAKQSELLSLADNQVEIISELGAGSEAMPDLTVATTIGDTDLLLVRQGTTDKSVAASVLKAAVGVADGAITTAKIADNAVTQAKMADNSVGTAEIINGGVTDAKIAGMSASKLTGDVNADRITSALNATGSAPIYACRAWVNFNGTGTVAIRGSGNVSSITDVAVGRYTVNFATAMPDANYSIGGFAGGPTVGSDIYVPSFDDVTNTYTASAVGIRLIDEESSNNDAAYVTINVFR